ncbi:hypothetical protein GGI24_001984 [Coemansia furcata]|nr:hypothetical protein GGI24_001984 [Coemansia furcata]
MPPRPRPGPSGSRTTNTNQEADVDLEPEDVEFSAPSNGSPLTLDIPPAPAQHATLPALTFFSQNIVSLGKNRTIQDRNQANKKLQYLRARALSCTHHPDFIFIQEITWREDPSQELQRAINSYTPLVPRWHTGDQPSTGHDTAILVRNNFGHAILQEEVSTPHQTLVCVPSLNLLVANVHGPSEDGPQRRSFFDALLIILSCYQREGWTVIVGGDFNIAPQPCD